MRTRNWNELESEMLRGRPDREARIEALVQEEAARRERYQHTLSELRKARARTQVDVAAALGATQGEVSKLERRSDFYLSTLARYVEALGGELELVATFDGEKYSLRVGDLMGPDTAPAEPEPTAGAVPATLLRA